MDTPDFPLLDGTAAELAAPMLAELAAHEAAEAERRHAELMEGLTAALAGRYAIERELGRGGMATVHLAHDLRHDRLVAIKVVDRELVTPSGAERFLQEIRTAARLTHPHVLSVHDSGEAAGLLYYVMPYAEGETLRALLDREGPLPVPEAMQLLRELADALAHAHGQGFVHRDLKPDNVLLVGGHAVVADFGIACALADARRDDVMLGTPAYMAPESVVRGGAADHRADLYALGIVAHEVLTGTHPFGPLVPEAMVAAHRSEPPPPLHERCPEAPAGLATLVDALLSKDPAARPQTAELVLHALRVSAAEHGGRRRIGRPAAAAVGLVLVLLTVLAVRGTTRQTGEEGGSAAAAREASVAVLPFTNLGGDSADTHLSDGLADELITALGGIDGLRVTGRASSFALRGRQLDAAETAAALGAGTLVEGSVRRDGESVSVGARLVSGADGTVLWAETYEGGVADLFGIREAIAASVAGALRVRPDKADAPPTTSVPAYEAYLKGRYIFTSRTNREGTMQALDYFTQAVALDSTYARAWAGISDAHARLAIFGYASPAEAFEQGRRAAERALAIDSTLPEAQVVLAHIRLVRDFEYSAAERDLRRVLARDPGHTFARGPLAVSLMGRRRFAEAIAVLDSGWARDPLAVTTINLLGRVYVAAGQPDDAIGVLEQLLELNPQLDLAYQQLGHAYLQKGMKDEAIAAFQRAAELSGPRDSAQLAYAYAVTGRREEAERVLDAVLTPSRRDESALAYHFAMAYAGLGDADAAFRWLERGYQARSSFMVGIAAEPGFARLRADRRWAELLGRMGL